MQKDIFIGDIHGEFDTLYYNLRINKLKNINIFVCGDIGIGFEKPVHYQQTWKKMNEYCMKNNIFIYFMRGNHDNPIFFQEDTPQYDAVQSLSNINIIQDFDIIKTDTNKILCIGGAVSVDRYMRKDGKNWWRNERVKNIDLEDYIKDKEFNIIISHTAPECFGTPGMGHGTLQYFFMMDPELENDIKNEGALMNEYCDIILSKNIPMRWFYGHFHNKHEGNWGTILYRCLDVEEFNINMRKI